MRLFTIVPVDPSNSDAELTAIDGEAVLEIVGRLDCKEADILQDDSYAFSVRMSDNGVWSIFRRRTGARSPCTA
jgi:hypothetical protein